MTEKKKYIAQKEKNELRLKLYKRDGSNCHYCHYCGIKEEDFIPIWGKFYGGKTRGIRLEIDRKDNKRDYNLENCVLACAICNNAKSDKFTYQEFLRMGKTIREIWISRRKNLKKEVFKKVKRKCFLVILFLTLAIFLSGCGGIVTPATDEVKIKNVIQEYALALNDQNWSKAKSYCIYGSDVYYSVCVKEDAVNALYQYCNVVTLTYYVTILDINVSGNYAEAYINCKSAISACGYFESFNINQYGYLQRVGNTWKLYGASQPID